jgi:hypothetical protein
MRRSVAGLGLAALAVVGVIDRPASAGSATTVKPYIVFILDVSGSMTDATGFGPPSCSNTDTKMDHAKCAIQKIANSYGDMVLALARFRVTTGSDNVCNDGNGCSTAAGIDCSLCNSGAGTCPAANGDQFEVLAPLLDNNQATLIPWVDNICTTCAPGSANPELFATGWTPIAGSLVGDKLYWQGLPSPSNGAYWTGPGSDPIRNDPLKSVFLPSGNQCRPYITILLTDGAETCTLPANDFPAAASLLTTAVDGKTYRIETKPIGFGIAPGDTQIEGIAHAGGAVDVAGKNEGYYAQNEDDVELAVSTIVAGALKFETCNNLDDDCDGQIDEDFPNKGKACDDGKQGICKGTGTFVCDTAGTGVTCNITNPGGTATTEICNGLDDDCDGLVDEGACTSCPGTVEICNNMDDDCDGKVDEDLQRPCGSNVGICTPGTEICTAGVWGACSGTGPQQETCNGLDDDCDGVVDGFAQSCTNMPNPPGNPNKGICHPGTQVCPSDGSGKFGPCLGEVVPQSEVCNGLDDDCDGNVDEDTGGGNCSSSCGVGTIECVNGSLQCVGSSGPQPEVCNGFDDDCDGIVDEDVPDGPACNANGTICNGVEKCVAGTYQCEGQPVAQEQCNCKDDDCDGTVDEDVQCGAGAKCEACQCAFPCGGGEFPCPAGKICNADNYCVNDPCFGVNCPNDPQGNKETCKDGTCVLACSLVTCPTGTICLGSTGECAFNDCRTFPDMCTAQQQCVNGVCVDNPCANVTCGSNQYCSGGHCIDSCAGVTCDSGQHCEMGMCVSDPCGHTCPNGEVCNTTSHQCESDPCQPIVCPPGQVCDPQTLGCVADPCATITCPSGQVCKTGSCYAPDQFNPDAGGPPQYVTTGGGGCAAGGGGGALGLAVVLGSLLARRRRPVSPIPSGPRLPRRRRRA